MKKQAISIGFLICFLIIAPFNQMQMEYKPTEENGTDFEYVLDN